MTMKQILQECSPHYHPFRWLGINCGVLAWSFIMLVRITSTDDTSNDEQNTDIELSYLFYNFVTTGVWLIEVSFNLLDERAYFDSLEESQLEENLLQPIPEKIQGGEIALWVELGFGVYFFFDSSSVAYRLTRFQAHRQAEGMTVDVCLNFAAYTFMVSQQFVGWRETRQNTSDGQAEQSSLGST